MSHTRFHIQHAAITLVSAFWNRYRSAKNGKFRQKPGDRSAANPFTRRHVEGPIWVFHGEGKAGMSEPLPKLLTPQEVRAALGLKHRDTVYNMFRNGQIKAMRVGRSWRVHPDDFAAYLAGVER